MAGWVSLVLFYDLTLAAVLDRKEDLRHNLWNLLVVPARKREAPTPQVTDRRGRKVKLEKLLGETARIWMNLVQRKACTASHLLWKNSGRLIHHLKVEIKHWLLISWRRRAQRGALWVWGHYNPLGVVGCDLLQCAWLFWLLSFEQGWEPTKPGYFAY